MAATTVTGLVNLNSPKTVFSSFLNFSKKAQDTYDQIDTTQKVQTYACAKCGKNGSDLFLDGKCKRVHYCKIECQKEHWPSHKSNCEAPLYCNDEKVLELVEEVFKSNSFVIKKIHFLYESEKIGIAAHKLVVIHNPQGFEFQSDVNLSSNAQKLIGTDRTISEELIEKIKEHKDLHLHNGLINGKTGYEIFSNVTLKV